MLRMTNADPITFSTESNTKKVKQLFGTKFAV